MGVVDLNVIPASKADYQGAVLIDVIVTLELDTYSTVFALSFGIMADCSFGRRNTVSGSLDIFPMFCESYLYQLLVISRLLSRTFIDILWLVTCNYPVWTIVASLPTTCRLYRIPCSFFSIYITYNSYV